MTKSLLKGMSDAGARLSRLSILFMFGFCALSLNAGETAVWSDKGVRGNVATRDPFSDGFWQGGVAPAFTNAASTNIVVDLSATATAAKRLAEIAAGETGKYYGPTVLRHEFSDSDNTAVYLGGLTGGVWTTWSFYWSNSSYPMVIRDGADYEGIFDVKDDMRNNAVQFYFLPAPGATSTVNRICVSGGPGVKVPTGSTLLVKDAFGAGSIGVNENAEVGKTAYGQACPLPKATAGTVIIANPPGPLTSLRVADGQVILHGHAASVSGPAGAPALRLDASCADSLTTTGASACVTQWRDADGRTAHLADCLTDGVHVPRLVTDSATGKKAVDFGGLLGATDALQSEATWGAAALMTVSPSVRGAVEIHVVFRDHFSANPMPTLVGNGLDEWNRVWLRNAAGVLFNTSWCDAPVAYGNVLFNGQRTQADAKPDTRLTLNVVSSSLSGGHLGQVTYIGGAAKYDSWQGGAEIAELIVYTNVLTEAERQATHRYLMAKWRPETKLWDYERIQLSKNAELDVPKGILSVRELGLPENATTFTKRGAGTLELGSYPASLKEIVIEDGDVAFANGHVASAAPQIATGATAHFDASRWETDVEWFQDGDKKRVRVWNAVERTNRNGDAYTLQTPASYAGYVPTNATVRANAAPTGLAMIDCGPYRQVETGTKVITNDATMLTFRRNGTQETRSDERHREGFLVYRKTADEATALSCVYWTIVKMASNKGTMFANRSYSYNRLIAGYWTYDGTWMEPWSCANTKDEIHVVAFRGTRPLAMNSFFNDRDYYPDGGGQIGEVVYYDRTLSPQERRDTELYLLRKWKNANATHPCDALLPKALPKLVYTKPVKEPVIHVDDGSSVTAPALDVASLAKTGAGTLTTVVQSEHLQSVAVGGGCLRLGEDVCPGAAFHADATDVSSMTYTVDGQGVTNVSKWAGATAITTFNSQPTRSPQLVQADLNGLGATMPLMDFGVQAKNTETDLLPNAASMTWPQLGPLQEFYIVFQDKTAEDSSSAANHPQVIGMTQEDSSVNPQCSYPFHRQTGTRVIATDWSSMTLNAGYTGMDGVKVPITTTITDTNLHVYSFAATTAITNKNFAFVRRTSYRIGGGCVGECIAFSGTNTVVRRTAIENHLRAKWLGHDVPYAPSLWDLGSIVLSDGGELALTDGGTVSVAVLGGDGSVTFGTRSGGLTNTTALAFGFRGKDDYDTIAVNGDFAVASSGTATVTVDLAGPYRSAELAGEYVVFAADSFTAPENFAGWTFAVEGLPNRISGSLFFDPARGLVLRIYRSGLTVIVR